MMVTRVGSTTIAHPAHRRAIVMLATMTLALVMAWMALPAGAHRLQPTAHWARTLSANDTAHLHLVRSSGSLLYEEGSTTGSISGRERARFEVGATFVGGFTTYTSHGTLKGRGTATPHGSGRYESFSGSVVVTGGTGRYAHAHGRVRLYGTFDRKTYALVVQTTGTLSY